MARVNPAILLWARETAGLSLQQAAPKVGLKDTRKGSAEDRLAALERGDEEPARATLLRMVKAYRRPLLTFYMPNPPARAERGEDFRTLPEDRRADSAAAVDALLRDVRARQDGVRAILEEEGAEPLPFIAALDIDVGPEQAAAYLGKAIGFSLERFRNQRGVEAAFSYLRKAAEGAGVFVLLIGNLGSHQSAISPDVFRGIALADRVAPFIIINDQDAKSAWSFTLLHELTHLVIGASGISAGRAEGKVERFCNQVASLILMPDADLKTFDAALARAPELLGVQQAITEFANARNLSRPAVAYRLHLIGVLSQSTWEAVSQAFRDEYLTDRVRQKERDKASDGAPDYYVVRRHRIGAPLLDLVRRTLEEGNITPTRAAKILGVKARNVGTLVSRSAA
ncbi:ImmA/IrrE family metallo-endopeptidase [Methylobacterium oryzisoli]|uniref:ImmA/IrrE family metallo-endopeptidase n=1 Tax=Methylobacterium oryzisoli TaxID=3385502 RepID=UPI003891D6E3